MNLIDVKTSEQVKAKIRRYTPKKKELHSIEHLFDFNWIKEKKNQVFCLETISSNGIIGLMSINDISTELRIHINLIESSIPNRGRNKEIKNIPHCLLAFAAKQAFAFGYDGFVSLYPKTDLVNYYVNEYGFEQIGTHLAIYGQNSYDLIQKYLI